MQDAGSAVARNPDSNVNACLAMLITPSPLVLVKNTSTSAFASTLCEDTIAAAAYKAPISMNGRCERIAVCVNLALGAPIIAPYSGNTATVPTVNSVSGKPFTTTPDPRASAFVPYPDATDQSRTALVHSPRRRVSTLFFADNTSRCPLVGPIPAHPDRLRPIPRDTFMTPLDVPA